MSEKGKVAYSSRGEKKPLSLRVEEKEESQDAQTEIKGKLLMNCEKSPLVPHSRGKSKT